MTDSKAHRLREYMNPMIDGFSVPIYISQEPLGPCR
jgi:hypothetical protein